MHKDGKGLDIVLELTPAGEPRLVLREREEAEKKSRVETSPNKPNLL